MLLLFKLLTRRFSLSVRYQMWSIMSRLPYVNYPIQSEYHRFYFFTAVLNMITALEQPVP
jgi:hypothetical protein